MSDSSDDWDVGAAADTVPLRRARHSNGLMGSPSDCRRASHNNSSHKLPADLPV